MELPTMRGPRLRRIHRAVAALTHAAGGVLLLATPAAAAGSIVVSLSTAAAGTTVVVFGRLPLIASAYCRVGGRAVLTSAARCSRPAVRVLR